MKLVTQGINIEVLLFGTNEDKLRGTARLVDELSGITVTVPISPDSIKIISELIEADAELQLTRAR